MSSDQGCEVNDYKDVRTLVVPSLKSTRLEQPASHRATETEDQSHETRKIGKHVIDLTSIKTVQLVTIDYSSSPNRVSNTTPAEEKMRSL